MTLSSHLSIYDLVIFFTINKNGSQTICAQVLFSWNLIDWIDPILVRPLNKLVSPYSTFLIVCEWL